MKFISILLMIGGNNAMHNLEASKGGTGVEQRQIQLFNAQEQRQSREATLCLSGFASCYEENLDS